jgi:uncharacterized protein YqgC (DUF456 family)
LSGRTQPGVNVSILIVLGYIIFVAALLAGIVACLAGMPGTALILLAGVGLSAATHWERPEPWVLLVLGVLALLAETLDNVLSVAATRSHGGSSRTGWMVMLGSVAGALLGALMSPAIGAAGLLGGPVGFIVSVVIVPLVLAAVGGYCAAHWYELRQGKTPQEARQAATGSLVGRLLGVMGKSLLAVIMSGVLLWVAFVHHA